MSDSDSDKAGVRKLVDEEGLTALSQGVFSSLGTEIDASAKQDILEF